MAYGSISISKSRLRQNIAAEQGNKCHYCGERMIKGRPDTARKKGMSRLNRIATLEHITPTCNGGQKIRSNLVVACHLCNNLRGQMDYDKFRAIMKSPYFLKHVYLSKRNHSFMQEIRRRIKPFRSIAHI